MSYCVCARVCEFLWVFVRVSYCGCVSEIETELLCVCELLWVFVRVSYCGCVSVLETGLLCV